MSLASCNEIVINLNAAINYEWSLTRLGVVTCVCVLLHSGLMLTVGNRIIQRHLKVIFCLSFVMMCGCAYIHTHIMKKLSLFLPHVTEISEQVLQHTQIIFAILVNTFTGLTGAVLARSFLFQIVTVLPS